MKIVKSRTINKVRRDGTNQANQIGLQNIHTTHIGPYYNREKKGIAHIGTHIGHRFCTYWSHILHILVTNILSTMIVKRRGLQWCHTPLALLEQGYDAVPFDST